jgi:SAM-dependent methyltransferase
MSIAVLYPRFDHPAIEERYASWQTQMRLRRTLERTEFDFYDDHETAADVVAGVHAPHVLVVTDPLVLTSPAIGVRLREVVESTGAAAAVPVTNEARHPRQQRPAPAPYLTLRELEGVFAQFESAPPQSGDLLLWDASDPTVYVCRTPFLATVHEPLRHALRGRDVAIDGVTYVHVWSALRAQTRDDLLPFIPETARSLLELGCGEAALGALIKKRQRCRVVGVELDPDAAAVARKRIDDVYCGDVRHIVELLDEQFECIVTSEILEHVDDPWSLLAELRRITTKGGRLVVSIPNVANASIVGDLLHGRFDYTYIGLTCAGHLRFFTRSTLAELFEIAGWTVEQIVPQRALVSAAGEELLAKLRGCGIDFEEEELLATGYYVVARNE